MINPRFFGFLVIFLGTLFQSHAQFYYQPLSDNYYRLHRSDSLEDHDAVWPKVAARESFPFGQSKPEAKWLNRKLWHEHFFQWENEDYALSIDPFFDFSFGKDFTGQENTTYKNTRGFFIQGRIGKKVSFFTSFTENQARFTEFYHLLADSLGVVPGEGKLRNFKEGDFDYSNVRGAVTYQPGKYFAFTFGQGKNKFGDGYRSFFLSDIGFNYPYFKIETTVGRVKYINLWTQMLDIRNQVKTNQQFRKKFMAMHFLSYQASARWNFQLFEGVTYKSDTLNGGFEVSYLNPVILYRSLEFANSSAAGNVVLGVGTSYKPWDGAKIYGQFILDEFVLKEFRDEPGSWRNKFAWQIGFSDYDLLGVEGLDFRTEFNYARPYTFSHSDVLTNYGHYQQPVGHPYGANFWEWIFQAGYRMDRWEVNLQINFSHQGLDSINQNWGADIYKPYGTREQDDNNKVAQGNLLKRTIIQPTISYTVNPSYNWRVFIGAIMRSTNETVPNYGSQGETLNFHFGMKTDLFNHYYDY